MLSLTSDGSLVTFACGHILLKMSRQVIQSKNTRILPDSVSGLDSTISTYLSEQVFEVPLVGKSLFAKAGLNLLWKFFDHVIVTSESSQPLASWSFRKILILLRPLSRAQASSLSLWPTMISGSIYLVVHYHDGLQLVPL